MVVRMTYNAVANTYDAQKQAFAGGAKVFNWTDSRIPTRYQIWTTTQASIQAYLDADADGKIAAVDPLVNGLGAATHDHLIGAMPEIDRTYWRQQMVRRAAQTTHQAYYDTEVGLRQAAIFAAFPPAGGLGPARRPTRRALAQVNLPPEPLRYNDWVRVVANRRTIATALQNNTNHASEDWTDAERLAVTAHSVEQAVFA